MAPRQPKLMTDDASATPSPLKPKTEKAKVEKVKSDKPKSEKTKAAAVAKAEKIEKAVAGTKAEKVEKAVKPKTKAVAAEKDEKEIKDVKEKAVKPAVKKEKVAEKDGKEKVKPVTGDEAVELITAYLKGQNRPYSATEISANLHNKVTKTVADKLLKELEQNGLIMAKATNGTNKGSQWVFWAIQDAADAATPEDLATMDTDITTLRESLPALKNSLKILMNKLNALRSEPTTSQLTAIVENLRAENRSKKEKLDAYKDGTVKMVTKDEIANVEKELKYWGARKKARRNGYLNLEGVLLEAFTKEQIEENIGCEIDYDA